MKIAGLIVFVMVCYCKAVDGQLTATFYATTCPQALGIVRTVVTQAVSTEQRMAASLLRLHFHDCFVNGCDGSILLDDRGTFTGEKTAGQNANSVRGYEVIDAIKTRVEVACSGVVSCADIVAIAARDSVVALGGPTWTVLLGRRDSTTASKSAATSSLPSFASDLNKLISVFGAQGLSAKDMIALSGGHTIGQARCVTFRARIYNDTNIETEFAAALRGKCPKAIGSGDNNLSPIDVASPIAFDNKYYADLRSRKGLFHSDQELFNGGSADAQVTTYATNTLSFFCDFAAAMVKMGNIKPLTGRNGQVRRNCRRVN